MWATGAAPNRDRVETRKAMEAQLRWIGEILARENIISPTSHGFAEIAKFLALARTRENAIKAPEMGAWMGNVK